MINKALLLTVCAALVALLPAAPSLAQQPESDEVVKVNTDLVVLDAQVINKKTGQPVADLKREDFELYEDGIKQEIRYFSRDELPLSIMLLLDVSGSVRPIIEQIGEGALNALQRLKPQDEVAVMAFATRAELVQDFTRDRKLIAEKIRAASKLDYIGNGTYLSEALFEAAVHMPVAANPSSRRVVIVVTDNIAPLGDKETVQRTMTELFESGSVVYGLIVRAALGKLANVLTFGLIRGVKTFSEQTGGEIINADKKEVDDKLSEMVSHLRTRYSLGYIPSNTKEDDRLRRLQLKLTPAALGRKGKVKMAVTTRQGYYFRRRKA
ncbi:MAG TPA: VWA domain-containing protein [Pyrinomonadaceae bacterium]